MGAFFLACQAMSAELLRHTQIAAKHFKGAGFPEPVVRQTPRYTLLLYDKIGTPKSACFVSRKDMFLGCVGTLVYRNKSGMSALEAMFGAKDLDAALEDCLGHFVLIRDYQAVLEIRRDRNSALEVYHDAGNSIFSTSLLATAQCADSLAFCRQGVYEYVFNGVSLGNQTIISSVRKLGFEARVVVDERAQIRQPPPLRLTPERRVKAPELAAQMLSALKSSIAAVAGAFGNRMTLALSAGYDTRLLLAACRSLGTVPQLFVYGGDADPDVLIAKQIAQAEGLDLAHINKHVAQSRLTAADFAAATAANYVDYDGIGPFGILSTRAEHEARLTRHAAGAVNLHGGGGEILRNFFGLPDRPARPLRIVQAFFSQYDISVCEHSFRRDIYEARIVEKIDALLKPDGQLIGRREIESLYPHFRCRSWFGRDNSINLRYGHGFMPFYENRYVDRGLEIPVSYKNSGNFESLMIRLADPGLARHQSGYGFNFSAPAPLSQQWLDRLKSYRPGWLRRHSFALQQRRRPAEPVWYAEWLPDVIDVTFPMMRQLFRIERVKDVDQIGRIASIEYLAHQLKVGDVDDA